MSGVPVCAIDVPMVKVASHRRRLDEVRQRFQAVTGRHASLEALQQAALGKEEGGALHRYRF